jgi:hypothetical protein
MWYHYLELFESILHIDQVVVKNFLGHIEQFEDALVSARVINVVALFTRCDYIFCFQHR